MRFTAFVPWPDAEQLKKQRKGGKYRDADEDEEASVGGVQPPNPTHLVFWNLVGIGLVIVAWRTTSWAEWSALAATFGMKI
jgi:hypothetical protein